MNTKSRVSVCALFLFLIICTSGSASFAAVKGEPVSQVSFLFDNLSRLLFVMAFTGIISGAYIRRIDTYIDKDKVWRHDFSEK